MDRVVAAGMDSRINEYLAEAEACEARARETRDPETRRAYEELARGGRELAAQLKRL
jgi:hypothetical protein